MKKNIILFVVITLVFLSSFASINYIIIDDYLAQNTFITNDLKNRLGSFSSDSIIAFAQDSSLRDNSSEIALNPEMEPYKVHNSLYTDYVTITLEYLNTGPESVATFSDEESIISKNGSYGVYIDLTDVSAIVNGQTLTAPTSFSDWIHIVLTYDKNAVSDQQKLYVDGMLGAQMTLTESININSNNLTFGNYFNGTIDEIKVWNRALSAEEINASYNAGLYRLETNLTNLEDGTYNYTAYTQDIAGNINQTETRILNIDQTQPVFSNLVYDSDVYAGDGSTIIKIDVDDIYPGIDTAIIEENSTGTPINNTMIIESGDQNSRTYNYTLTYDSIGDILFTIYLNDTARNLNKTTTYTIHVKNITVSVNFDKISYSDGEDLFITGTPTLIPDNLNISDNEIHIYLDDIELLYNSSTGYIEEEGNQQLTTDSNGNYSYKLKTPDSLTSHYVKVNITYLNEFEGENSKKINIWTLSKVNHTATTDYTKGDNTEYNITAYYWRTDRAQDEPINGLINITVFNETFSLSKTCTSQSSCRKPFMIGPTGDLPGGNYTIYINASNQSAFYLPNSTSYNIYLEEPNATAILIDPNKDIIDYSFAHEYSFLHNMTLNNTNRASLYDPEIFEIVIPSKIKSVVPQNACPARIYPYEICVVTFNITVKSGQEGTSTIKWTGNWSNNQGSTDFLNGSTTVALLGNPKMELSLHKINITGNLSESNIYYTNLSNTGNVLLTNVGANKPFPDWIEYYNIKDNTDDPSESWDGQYWTSIYLVDYHTMKINITLKNFSQAYYDTTIDFTNTQGNLEKINLTITVEPNMSVSTTSMTAEENLSGILSLPIGVNSTGNSPITNVSIYLEENTMPAEWISFNSTGSWQGNAWGRINEFTGRTLNVLFNVTNYTSALYTGKIIIVTNETSNGAPLNRTVDLTLNVSPILTTLPLMYVHADHNKTNSYDLELNSTGTIKLVNVSVEYISENLPSGWVDITPSFVSQIVEHTHPDIELNVTVPVFTDPGNYTGKIRVTSYNVPERIINLTVYVVPDGTWYFTPSYNQTKEFGIGHTGEIANLTIHNIGNIPLNFSIQFGNAGLENCLEFGAGGTCIDYSHLNAPLSWEATGTDYIFVEKNSTSLLDMWQDNDDSEKHTDVGIKITLTNSSATPVSDTTYMFFDIIDQPPVIYKFETRVNSLVQNYVELNKEINFNVIVTDDVSDFGAEGTKGVNGTETYFNITYPNGTIIKLSATFVEEMPYSGDKDRFESNFVPTLAGNYTLLVYAVDISDTPHPVNSTIYFYVYGKTTLDVTGQQVSTSKVSLNDGDTVFVPVTINNSGFAYAYNINITTDAGSFWSENKTIGNLSVSEQNATTIEVQIPANITPDVYPVVIDVIYKNPDGTSNISSTITNVVVLSNQTYSVSNLSDELIFTNLEHGKTNQITFTVNGYGNSPSQDILVSTTGTPQGITLLMSKDNISFNPTTIVSVGNGNTKTIYLDIVIDAGESPGTTNHEFDIHLVNSQLQRDYTNLKAFIVTDNSWNITHEKNITINGVSGENKLNQDILITVNGNVPINFLFNLSGNTTSFMNLIDIAKTLQPRENYSIKLNYTAPYINEYYESNLTIDDQIGSTPNPIIQLRFNSFVFELNLTNLTTLSSVLSSDEINISAELKYGYNYITKNTTYYVFINGTICPVMGNTILNNKTIISCSTPTLTDGKEYNLSVRADYMSSEGLVQVVDNLSYNVYYKDVTPPKVTSMNITEFVEANTNSTMYLTITDNTQTDTAIAIIRYPNGTIFDSIVLFEYISTQYSGIIEMPSLLGVYSVEYKINDTTGNQNNSIQDNFEVYGWKNFSGVIQDLNSNPLNVSFTIKEPLTSEIITSFQTNSSGYYNATIKRRMYNLEMSFLDTIIQLENVDFSDLSFDFIDMDAPLTGDYGYKGDVIKGFAANTPIDAGGNITITYNPSEVLGITTNYLQIYKCPEWDYNNRNCNGGLVKLISTHDKIDRTLKASFSDFSGAYILVEDEPVEYPEMTIAASQIMFITGHGNTTTADLTIQSTGSVPLTNIQFCSEGIACSDFIVDVDSIIGLDVGASYDVPINVTVPKYYLPGTYEGKLEVTSNTHVIHAQYKEVIIKVTVPIDNNWSVTSNLTLDAIGSGITGQLGPITLENLANVPIDFEIASNTTNLVPTPDEITISKNNSDYIIITYNTPDEIGFYNYSINITGAGNTTVIYALINVTHAVNMTAILPNTNISAGQIMAINATANYLGIQQTENVTWSVFVDDTPCQSISSSYIGCEWYLLCEAPNMSAKISYALKVKGTFTGNENLVAYDSAYDLDNIYYVDALPPQVANHTINTEQTTSNVTVNATITDYSNITDVSVTIIAPNGTLLETIDVTSLENSTYSITYNFTDIGDYILRYNLEDDLNNAGIQDKYFEVYTDMTFSGTVSKSDATGLQTSFRLYRENQSFDTSHLIHQFTSASNGFYSETVHKRLYDFEMVADSNIVRLYNLNLTEHNDDPIDLDEVHGNEVQITGTEEMGGIAVKTAITNAGRITLSYVPDADTKEDNIYIYRCANWNFTEVRCDGAWDKLSRDDADLDKINNKISATISGFSAYVAAEVTPPIVVDITGSSSTGSGGGSSSGLSSSIDDIKDKITALFDGTSEFSVDTKSISKQLYPGEFVSFSLGVKNSLNITSNMTAKVMGEVSDFIIFDTNKLNLKSQESDVFLISISVPKDTYPGMYEGKIQLSNNNVDTVIPIGIRVLDSQNLPISVDVQPLIDSVSPGSSARVKLNIYNAGTNEIPINYTLSLIDPITGLVLVEIGNVTTVASTKSIYLNISIPDNITLENPKIEGLNNIQTKRYMLKASLSYNSQGHDITSDSVSFISVTSIVSLWNLSILGIPFWFILALIALSFTVYFARTRYLSWVGSKKKYIESIDLKTLPHATPRSGFIGKLAETDIRTFMNLDTLQTHTVVAGATGGGKTISAQVIIEEALKKGVSVIVFDPTAQWTGFLRPNRNKKMLKLYRDFNMKVNQSKAFDGNIYEVRDAREMIDIKSHMTPGEITVFTMNHLDTADIDFFVANTVKQVFHANFEESQELKLLIVYDEVHRLLKKYGGNGDGFIQIERAAREFRKWGVGLVLISQVLSDFIGTIKANIGTDIQFRTRDENDLERIKIKYGEDMMRSIVKASTGEGMIENAAYNHGRPYFVSFRPIYHAIERLSDSDLEKYSNYNSLIDDFNYQLECLKAENIDVFDLELEIKLTLDNLKRGKFNMVDIYLDGFKPKIDDLWKTLGRQPPKRVIRYADRDSIKKEVAKARLEHDVYVKKLKAENVESKGQHVVPKDNNDPSDAASDDNDRKSAAVSNDGEKVKQYDNGEWNFSNSSDNSKKTDNVSAGLKKQHSTVSKTGLRHKKDISNDISKKKSVYPSSSDDAKHRNKELIRIRSEVIGDIHKNARKEEKEKGIKRKTSTVRKPIENDTMQPSFSKTNTLESEVRSDYRFLMKKITEVNKSGEDTSIINIEAMSIPADIDVAIAHEDIIRLKSIKVKINDLLKTL